MSRQKKQWHKAVLAGVVLGLGLGSGASAATFEWQTPATSGPWDWNDGSNWTVVDGDPQGRVFPNAPGDIATEVATGSAPRQLHLNQDITLGELHDQQDFSEYHSGTGDNTLIFDNNGSNAVFTSRGQLRMFVNVRLDDNVAYSSPGFTRNQEISSAISGSGGITLGAGAAWSMLGSNANTYTGTTVVNNDGTGADRDWGLRLNRSDNVVAISGDLEITSNGLVLVESDGQIANTSAVTLQGLLDLNGNVDTIDALHVSGGAAELATGSASGVLTVLNSFTLNGVAQDPGIYTSTDYGFLTGEGQLIVVPEPASLGLVGVAGLMLLRRRRSA